MFEEAKRDSRWPTTDTRLAACMVTLGFMVKKEQPFITSLMIDEATQGIKGRQTTIWLEPIADTTEGPLNASRFGIAWQDMKTWGEANPSHPFISAYRGVMARQYLVQTYIHGNAVSISIRKAKYKTDNLTLASCLHGSGSECLGRDGREFLFGADAKPLIDIFNEPVARNIPLHWMKLAVTNYHLLNESIKRPENIPVVERRRVMPNGEIRVMQLPVNMPDDIRRTFEEHFYAK